MRIARCRACGQSVIQAGGDECQKASSHVKLNLSSFFITRNKARKFRVSLQVQNKNVRLAILGLHACVIEVAAAQRDVCYELHAKLESENKIEPRHVCGDLLCLASLSSFNAQLKARREANDIARVHDGQPLFNGPYLASGLIETHVWVLLRTWKKLG